MASVLDIIVQAKNNASGVLGQVERNTHSLGGAMQTAGRAAVVAGAAVATATAAGGAAFLRMGQMAGDLNETISKVNVVFDQSGGAIVKWAEDSAEKLGMSQNAALGAIGTYGNLFRAMGISERASADMSIGLTGLAADLASFNNMDPTEVLDKLRAGLSGETEPLKTLGVNLTAARIEAKAMEMGLADASGELSAAAKAQATYALILEDTTLAQGDFERTSGGMANQQRILGATMEDALTKLGQAAVPIIETILPQLVSAFSGLSNWATANAGAIGEGVSGALTVIGEVMVFLVTNVIPMLIGAFTFVSEEVIPRIVEVITFLAQNVLPGLVSMFKAIATWVAENWPAIQSVITQAFGAIANVIRSVWPVLEAIARVLFPAIGAAASILFGVLDRAFKLIGGVFEVAGRVASVVTSTIGRAFAAMGRVISGVWDGVTSTIKGGINFVIGLVNRVIGFLNNIRITIPSIDLPIIGRVGGFSIGLPHIPSIPRLASGAWDVLADTLAVIHRGEMVVPAGPASAIRGGFGGRGGGGGVSLTIHNFTGSDRELDRLMDRLARRLAIQKA